MASVLSGFQFPLTPCCSQPTVRLSPDAQPRCVGCGHRKVDPETGEKPGRTRDKGLGDIAVELPNRLRARWAGRSL